MEKKIVNVKKFGPFKYTETITYNIGNNLFEQAIDTIRCRLLFPQKQNKVQPKEHKRMKTFRLFK